jgi:hypothetical protein
MGDAAHGRIRVTCHWRKEDEGQTFIRQIKKSMESRGHGVHYSTRAEKNE